MATKTWIKFDGIDGESTDRDHKDEVDVLSWSWGLTAPTLSGAGGSGIGRAVPKDLRFIHRYDKASPLLGKAGASGQRLRTAVLSARKAGGKQPDFFMITLKDVLVSSVAAGDDGAGATEEIALSYGEIEFSYKPQSASGALGNPVSFDWNVRTGQVT